MGLRRPKELRGIQKLGQIVNSEFKSGVAIVRHHRDALFRGSYRHPWKEGNTPVLLLHGYLVGPASLFGLSRYLSIRGFNPDCPGYAFWEDLREVETVIANTLDRICQSRGEKVKIVGHSQGGLMGYALAQKHEENIERVLALGVPWKGTYLAWANWFVASARQMTPGNDYLLELEERGAPNVPIICIRSKYDQMVLPPRNSKLNSSSIDVCVEHVGHGGLITRECYPLIEKWLKKRL